MHRAPERRAPAAVSLFFALLALAPLGAFVVLALRAGANLKVSTQRWLASLVLAGLPEPPVSLGGPSPRPRLLYACAGLACIVLMAACWLAAGCRRSPRMVPAS